ncbi:MAG: DUF4255 domain-containing protein [Coleofasciculus sp. S288]|nr:DUF4255 domain-containing protein [Coleofasciculus sp. S288]
MSNSQALRDISNYLRQLLLDGLSGDDAIASDISVESISLDSPARLADNGGSNAEMSQPILSLYLYQVLPNGQLNNQALIPSGMGEQYYPPLSLNLYYLLTPLGATPDADLLVLGRAMQVFAAYPIVRANFLDSQLRPNSPEVRLTLNPLNLEEMTRIWNAFNQPYRLSACYQVQAVSIDSIRVPETAKPVREQLVDIHQIVAKNGGTR